MALAAVHLVLAVDSPDVPRYESCRCRWEWESVATNSKVFIVQWLRFEYLTMLYPFPYLILKCGHLPAHRLKKSKGVPPSAPLNASIHPLISHSLSKDFINKTVFVPSLCNTPSNVVLNGPQNIAICCALGLRYRECFLLRRRSLEEERRHGL